VAGDAVGIAARMSFRTHRLGGLKGHFPSRCFFQTSSNLPGVGGQPAPGAGAGEAAAHAFPCAAASNRVGLAPIS